MVHGLTVREQAILRSLLEKHGITNYEIIGATSEGRNLPGCSYDGEIELLSGTVVTTTTAYDFWLDWREGNYTFHPWREVNLDVTRDKEEIVEAQERLRQQSARDSS